MLTMRDPQPYDGPIERIDGTRPFNMYLWPTEQWLARDDLGDRWLSFDWRIEIIALADGRFASSGSVRSIEAGFCNIMERRCVFPDRAAAIRAAAAEVIRRARRIRQPDWRRTRLDWREKDIPIVITWARELVARETDSPPPRPRALPMPPPPVPPQRSTGLPLLDLMVQP